MSEDVITLNNVWKIFGDRALEAMHAVQQQGLSKPEVLKEFECVVGIADCSFTVNRGEIFCVMGLSGSGKSTMVRHINRLIEPTAGDITVLGKDVLALNGKELREMRAQHLGMVFQLNLDGYEDRFPRELSGGMQQRVGLARALASDPEVLLMDEPFSALDPLIRRQLQDQFMTLSDELNKTTVFITHDLDEAIRIGNRIAIMKDGRIVQIGTPEQIVTDPADDYVRDFVEGISKLKLVFAHSIMEPINEYQLASGDDLAMSPRADHGVNLDQLIDIATTTTQPIVIQDDSKDVGVISKSRLLKGIQGGKA